MPRLPILLAERAVPFEAVVFIRRVYRTITLSAVSLLQTNRLSLQHMCFELFKARLTPKFSITRGTRVLNVSTYAWRYGHAIRARLGIFMCGASSTALSTALADVPLRHSTC